MKSKGKKQSNRVIFLLLFFLLMVVGIFLGDVAKVLDKSIKICLECIGIG